MKLADLSDALLVGISSRALFNLEMEDELYNKAGPEAFFTYQRAHEDSRLDPGTGFPLVHALLGLNSGDPDVPRRAEVIILSKNHPDVYLRVRRSIREYGLDITRAFLTGGDPIAPLLDAYKFDLFLSADEQDVRDAVEAGFAAGRIYPAPMALPPRADKIRIAFDGDCVIFGDESERITETQGMLAFQEHERQLANVPLPDGPFANFLRKVTRMQGPNETESPFRIGLVTARNAPADERPLLTFRAWGVRIDNAAFLGGLPKDGWLMHFQPHIYFDDMEFWCKSASRVSRSALVPRKTSRGDRRNEFLLLCKGYIGGDQGLPIFERWYTDHLTVPGAPIDTLMDELAKSIAGTAPEGESRPPRAKDKTPTAGLLVFLDDLLNKNVISAPRE